VFSDIHANLEALERVLEEIETLHPDIVVSLGDVVGYGANPCECVDLVQEYASVRIGGNHDLASVGITDSNVFNPIAKRSIVWTSNVLRPKHKQIIEGYDPSRTYGKFLFSHASPVSPLQWEYIYTIGQAKSVFEKFDNKFIFTGHTHVPGIIIKDMSGSCYVAGGSIVQIEPQSRYLINVGSIGQPRDGISAASFALLDEKRRRINIRRVPYDILSAQEKIRSAGLPEPLATRLAAAR